MSKDFNEYTQLDEIDLSELPEKSTDLDEVLEFDPNSYQVGGDHYLHYPIPPIEFIQRNELDFVTGNVIKYVVRAGEKMGERAVTDLEKAIHYCQLRIAYIKQVDKEIDENIRKLKGN